MPNPAAWTDSQTKLVEIRLLDRIVAARRNGTTLDASDQEDLAESEVLAAAVAALVAADLISDANGTNSLLAMPAGGTLAQARAERRSNRKVRRMACRDALLDWCYEVGDRSSIDDFAADPRGNVEGDPFSVSEIAEASQDLKDKGLIRGSRGGLGRPSITADGKTVVETYASSIADYERRDSRPADVSLTFAGSTGSQVVLGDGNTITQTVGPAGGDLDKLIGAVVDAARGTDAYDRIVAASTQLRLETLEEAPDEGIVRKTLERMESAAVSAGSVALTRVVNSLVGAAVNWLTRG